MSLCIYIYSASQVNIDITLLKAGGDLSILKTSQLTDHTDTYIGQICKLYKPGGCPFLYPRTKTSELFENIRR